MRFSSVFQAVTVFCLEFVTAAPINSIDELAERADLHVDFGYISQPQASILTAAVGITLQTYELRRLPKLGV